MSHKPNERARVYCRAQTWPWSMERCRGRAAPQRSPSEGAQAASLSSLLLGHPAGMPSVVLGDQSVQ